MHFFNLNTRKHFLVMNIYYTKYVQLHRIFISFHTILDSD